MIFMAKNIGRMFADDMKDNFVSFGKTMAKKETWKSVGNGMKTVANYSGKLGRSTGNGGLSSDKSGKFTDTSTTGTSARWKGFCTQALSRRFWENMHGRHSQQQLQEGWSMLA